MKKVSVIVPFYNAERYIEDCITMLLKQSLDNYEIILINDGSTDRSLQICEKYIADDRIKLINKSNTGAWDTRNVGIEHSNSEYIMFVDCDDRVGSEWLEKMYKSITSDKVDLVISGQFDWIVTPGEKNQYRKVIVKEEYFPDKTTFLNNIVKLRKMGIGDVLWNKIYRADIIKKNKIRFNNIRRGEDVHFNLDYYNYVNKCRVVELYEYLYKVESDNLPWKKYGENYYGLVEDEYSFVRSKLSRWNVLNETSLQFQAKHLIYGLFDHIRGLILDKKQSRKLILDFIHEVIEREYCQEALENYNSDFSLVSLFVYFLKKRKLTLALNIMYLQIVGAWTKESIRKISIRDYMKNRRYNKQLESI